MFLCSLLFLLSVLEFLPVKLINKKGNEMKMYFGLPKYYFVENGGEIVLGTEEYYFKEQFILVYEYFIIIYLFYLSLYRCSFQL